MRVLEERLGGVKAGDRVDPRRLGLPLSGPGPALIVFWKGR